MSPCNDHNQRGYHHLLQPLPPTYHVFLLDKQQFLKYAHVLSCFCALPHIASSSADIMLAGSFNLLSPCLLEVFPDPMNEI